MLNKKELDQITAACSGMKRSTKRYEEKFSNHDMVIRYDDLMNLLKQYTVKKGDVIEPSTNNIDDDKSFMEQLSEL